MGFFDYLPSLLKDRQVASVAPSSRFALARVCRSIDFANAKVIIEYGPGLGVFTKYMLQRSQGDLRLIAFETNERFVRALRERISDPRLSVVHESAEKVLEVMQANSCAKADVVISGIPFSMIPEGVKETIIRNTAEALAPGGQFLTYQVFPPPASRDTFLKPHLEKYFDIVRIEYELRNIPPLRIYEARKKK